MTAPLLVWTPDADGAARLADLDGIEARATPADPLAAPGLDRVAVLVPGFGELPPLERMPALRLVQALSAGVDRYLARIPAGVTLCDGRGIHDVPVAEWVLAVLLAAAKRLPEHRDCQRAHVWREHPGADDLAGANVLILGYGSIGAAVERRLEPFEATVTRVARTARPGVHAATDLPRLLPAADAVVVLLPLTDATHRFVDAAFLAAMRRDALLVNAGRGPVVDTPALLEALRAGRVRAALDVTDPEPPPADHPLWDAPGLLLTPHVAGDSPRMADRAYALVRAQLRRLLAGEPLHNVVSAGY